MQSYPSYKISSGSPVPTKNDPRQSRPHRIRRRRVEEDHADVEFFPDARPLLAGRSCPGYAGYLGIETGLPSYPVKPSGFVYCHPRLATFVPYLGLRLSAG